MIAKAIPQFVKSKEQIETAKEWLKAGSIHGVKIGEAQRFSIVSAFYRLSVDEATLEEKDALFKIEKDADTSGDAYL